MAIIIFFIFHPVDGWKSRSVIEHGQNVIGFILYRTHSKGRESHRFAGTTTLRSYKHDVSRKDFGEMQTKVIIIYVKRTPFEKSKTKSVYFCF